jgi:uncharacterized protein with von Willebrand factor type A (vWA) domain
VSPLNFYNPQTKKMAGYKQYKNVYTILEKVKKGEIQSYYNNSQGLFGKLDFYKRPDLIKPYMHHIDERKVDTVVDAYINDQSCIGDAYRKLIRSGNFTEATEDDPGNKPDVNTFHKKVKEHYRSLPKHLTKDIHKLFYHQMDQLEFEDRSDANHTKFKLLEKANNPVSKIMTQGSNLKSSIFARNIMAYFAIRYAMMEYLDPESHKQFTDGLGGEGDNTQTDQAMKNMFDDDDSKSMLEKAMQNATNTCKDLDGSVDKETQEKMFNDVLKDGGKQAGQLSNDYIRKVAREMEKINMSLGTLKDKIKKLMDKSASYFSSKKEVTYDDLFNTDNISGLEDYIELHPKLRKIFVEDILIKDEKSIGKVDIYIDISGSMSDGSGLEDVNGNRITKLDFCKAFTIKLSELGMLNDVYLFNNSVKKFRNDPISIAMLDVDGGTTIDKAVVSVAKNDANALIITDAEDTCRTYSDKAFFIGVKGSNFSHFNSDVIKKYSENNQVVVFDGHKIYNVNEKGKTIA